MTTFMMCVAKVAGGINTLNKLGYQGKEIESKRLHKDMALVLIDESSGSATSIPTSSAVVYPGYPMF